MGTDNLDEDRDQAGGSSGSEQGQSSASDSEEKGSRMDAAKAFFRAMYAGEEPPPGPGPSGSAQTATEQAPSEASGRRVQELEAQVRDLEQRSSDAEGLYKRLMADFDNFRRRTEREREELQGVGARKVMETFIPALDDLERAMLYLTPDTPAEKIIESFQLVQSRMFTCLEQAGLKRMVAKGSMFDPRYHEPVQQIETSEHPDGSVVSELRTGYLLGDKVVRPALVNVAANSSGYIDIPADDPVTSEAQESSSGSPDNDQEESDSAGGKRKGKLSGEADARGVYDLGEGDEL